MYLAEAGWEATSVICFATELLLVGVSARFFTLAARQDATPDQQRLATLLTLGPWPSPCRRCHCPSP